MPPRLIALTLLAGFACAGQARAISLDEYRASLSGLQDRYRTSVAKCRPMLGNARDLCRVEARTDYDVTRAELKAQYQPTPRHQDKLRLQKAEAAYRLATERCDELRAGARKICEKDARASYIADFHAAKASRSATSTAATTVAARLQP